MHRKPFILGLVKLIIQIGMIGLWGTSDCNLTPAWSRYPTSGGNKGGEFDALRASLQSDGIWI